MSLLSRRRPQPHEVFTPGSLPLEEHNVYATRRAAEHDLDRCMKRRQVPLVYGEYGVGKTTVVRKFFQDEDAKGRVVYVPSAQGLSLTDVSRHALEKVDYSVVTERVSRSTVGVDGGVDLKIVKAGASGEESDEHRTQLVITSPTDIGMLKILDEHRVTVIIDEMHKALPAFRAELANFIKAVKSSNRQFPQIVLIGTTMDAERLVEPDPGIDRYVKEVAVPLMVESEANYIVNEGFKRLGLKIEAELANRIVAAAAGAPTIVHSLCLDAAESALDAGRDRVFEEDCRAAVRAYLSDHGRRLASAYMKAIETTGPKRYRKRVLHAVAETDTDYATMEDIRTRVSVALGEDTPSTALSGPLRALKEAEYGRVLQDVERVVSGARVHNLTTFTDPMMKSFVRFMHHIDDTSLMPAPEELPAPE